MSGHACSRMTIWLPVGTLSPTTAPPCGWGGRGGSRTKERLQSSDWQRVAWANSCCSHRSRDLWLVWGKNLWWSQFGKSSSDETIDLWRVPDSFMRIRHNTLHYISLLPLGAKYHVRVRTRDVWTPQTMWFSKKCKGILILLQFSRAADTSAPSIGRRPPTGLWQENCGCCVQFKCCIRSSL